MTHIPTVQISQRDGPHRGSTPPAMYAISGVLFDLDNTLFDRDKTFLAWAQWFVRDQMGIADTDAAHTLIDLMVELDASGYGPKEALFRRVKQRYPQLADDVHTLTAAFFHEHLRYVQLDNDTHSLLTSLEAHHIPWGIVTNGSPNQLLKIERLGFDQRTCCMFVSEIERIRKPEPEIFLRAARCLGVAPPAILFVGDNPHADIMEAQTFGMRTAWLHRGQCWPQSLPNHQPDFIIGALTSLRIAASREAS